MTTALKHKPAKEKHNAIAAGVEAIDWTCVAGDLDASGTDVDGGTALAGTAVVSVIQFAAAALAIAACFKAISAAYLGERAGVA